MPTYPSPKTIRLALITAFLSGFAVFINKFGVQLWTNSSTYTTAKNAVTVIFLTAALIGLKKFSELKHLSKSTWIKLILIGLIGGSLPFILFFKSLALIPAAEAAFIHKTLFLWVALLAHPFLKERLSALQFSALLILFAGVYFSGAPQTWKFGAGALLAVCATILWAIENIIAKVVLREEISGITVAWGRMFFGTIFLFIYLLFTKQAQNLIPTTQGELVWAILSGAFLFGYVATWYTALKQAPATIVTSILVIAAPITALLDGVFVNRVFPVKVIAPLLLMIVGIILISLHRSRISNSKFQIPNPK